MASDPRSEKANGGSKQNGAEDSIIDRDRRTLLRVGAVGAAGLAGCFRGGDETPTATRGGGTLTATPDEGSPATTPDDGTPTDTGVEPAPTQGIYGPLEWPAPLYEDECEPRHFDEEGRRVLVTNECPLAEHPRHSGPVTAMDWVHTNIEGEEQSYEPADFSHVAFNFNMSALGSYYQDLDWNLDIPQEKLDELVDWLDQWPEGKRGLTVVHSVNEMVSGGWKNRDRRDSPILAVLSEDVSGRPDTLPVEPVPTDWSTDDIINLAIVHSHEIPYGGNKPGSGDTEVYFKLKEDIEQGDTTLSIDVHKEGTELDASAGDPVLIMAGVQNSMWMYHTYQNLQYYIDQVREALEDAGVELDYLISDSENVMAKVKKANSNDPRWEDPAHGFGGKSLAELEEEYGYDALHGWRGGPVKEWTLSAGLFYPLKKAFPDLTGSDYGSIGRHPAAQDSSYDGYAGYAGFPGHFGTHGSQEYYGRTGFGNLGGGGQADTPLIQIQATLAHLRGHWWAAGGRIQPWIGLPSWGGDDAYSPAVSFTPYYDELIYQLGLHEPDPILVFGHGGDAPADHVYLDGLLEELNGTLDGAFSLLTADKSVTDPSNLSSTLEEDKGGGGAVTGARLEDDTGLWRLTVMRDEEEYEWSRSDGGSVNGASSIGVTVTDGEETVDTFEVGTDEVGTWWRHDEANPEFAFQLEYAD